MTCNVCGRPLDPREVAAGYAGRCEDCWAGHRRGRLGTTAAECHDGGRGGEVAEVTNQDCVAYHTGYASTASGRRRRAP